MTPTPGAGPKQSLTTSLFSGRYENSGSSPGYDFAGIAGWDNFLAAGQKAADQGLRLRAINVFQDGQTIWYTGVWIESGEPFGFYVTSDWDLLLQNFEEAKQQKLGMVDLNIAITNGTPYYTAVYLGYQGEQKLVHDVTASALTVEKDALNTTDMLLVKLQARADTSGPGDPQILYTGLFQQGPQGSGPSNGLWTGQSFRDLYNYLQTDPNSDNLNCLQVLDYGVSGAQNVVAVWVPSSNPRKYVLAQTWDNFVAQWKDLSGRGYRLQSIEVQQMPVDWKAALYQVLNGRTAGYTFSMRQGNVINSGAFGDAIRPGSTGRVPMTMDTPVTVGSVSKTIEAVAMLLAGQKKNDLNKTLDAPFFDLIKGFRGISDADVKDDRMKKIQVRHLLTHTAPVNEPGGPQNTDALLWDYIKRYLGMPIIAEKLGPAGEFGVVYSYSSAGFQVIRGVVQAIFLASTYQDWVTDNIFRPLKMSATYIPIPGKDYQLRYYNRDLVLTPPNPDNPSPPGVIATEASWNSSASDMVKLMACLRDGNLLTPDTLKVMFAPTCLKYRYDDTAGKRVDFRGEICFGFDAVWPPLPGPDYLTKNGMYTNYSQAATLRRTSSPLDVTLQINTDTGTVPPPTNGSDNQSIWPADVLTNAFKKMIP